MSLLVKIGKLATQWWRSSLPFFLKFYRFQGVELLVHITSTFCSKGPFCKVKDLKPHKKSPLRVVLWFNESLELKLVQCRGVIYGLSSWRTCLLLGRAKHINVSVLSKWLTGHFQLYFALIVIDETWGYCGLNLCQSSLEIPWFWGWE